MDLEDSEDWRIRKRWIFGVNFIFQTTLNNKGEGNREKHENGEARANRDKGGEKGDVNRRPKK